MTKQKTKRGRVDRRVEVDALLWKRLKLRATEEERTIPQMLEIILGAALASPPRNRRYE